MEHAAQRTFDLISCLIDLCPISVVGLCLIYKLEKLTDQGFQAKLLPSLPSGNSEPKLPHAFGIPNYLPHPLHGFRILVQETPLSLRILRCCPWYGLCGYFLESPYLSLLLYKQVYSHNYKMKLKPCFHVHLVVFFGFLLIRLRASCVLLVGIKGLGAEICKNLVLSGVKSVTIVDPSPVNEHDFVSQFLVQRQDLGKNVSQIIHRRARV